MSDLSALPSVPASALPAEVRAGSLAEQKGYRAALGFERILLGELVQDMTKAGGLADSPRAGAIEDAMSDALLGGGGLGLGLQLFRDMHPKVPAQPPVPAGTGGATARVRKIAADRDAEVIELRKAEAEAAAALAAPAPEPVLDVAPEAELDPVSFSSDA